MTFADLNIDEKLQRAVTACNFSTPTEVQARVIPAALAGHDLMASAQTGTGKTAAFVIPALQHLLTPPAVKGRGPRVLILTPTRELAMQVNDHIRALAQTSNFRCGTVVGGMAYLPQERLLQRPLDLLVATPGRLMDHMQRGRLDFSRLEILVLDEADRMLDMGFVNAVKSIALALPAKRMTWLFSATLEGRVLEIAQQLLRDPLRIQLTGNRIEHMAIAQVVHDVDTVAHKHLLLTHYLKDDSLSRAVIFAATKRGADQLSRSLVQQGFASEALHGDMSQNQRRSTVERMRRGDFHLLVATDVAARGLDIQGISHVINFDLPMVAEDYIHRIGRTGRAGASGTAISLVNANDRRLLACIERMTGRRLQRAVIPGLEPQPQPQRPAPTAGSRRQPGGASFKTRRSPRASRW